MDRAFVQRCRCRAGERTISSAEVSFPNTIKSEYTDKFSVEAYLEAGTHTIKFEHKSGTFVLDSMLVRPVDTDKNIALLPDADRSIGGITSYLAVAPHDGFYELETVADCEISVDGAKGILNGTTAVVYLRRGLNYIDISAKNAPLNVVISDKNGFTSSFKAVDFELSDGAVLNRGGYIQNMAANEGNATVKFKVPKDGSYRVTLTYSNNLEGGYHAYNVDLIESFLTVTTRNGSENIWCRSTYSWDTYKTVTFNLELDEGENTVTFSNNGAYDFNGSVPVSPRIKEITINQAVSGDKNE